MLLYVRIAIKTQAEAANLSVHAAVARHIQWMESHQVLFTVARPSTQVAGEARSMPHVRPYTLTNAQCRNAASVATATDNTRSRRAEGRNGRVGAGCNCCTGSANVTDRRRALRNLRVGAGAGEG